MGGGGCGFGRVCWLRGSFMVVSMMSVLPLGRFEGGFGRWANEGYT